MSRSQEYVNTSLTIICFSLSCYQKLNCVSTASSWKGGDWLCCWLYPRLRCLERVECNRFNQNVARKVVQVLCKQIRNERCACASHVTTTLCAFFLRSRMNAHRCLSKTGQPLRWWHVRCQTSNTRPWVPLEWTCRMSFKWTPADHHHCS